MWPIRQEVIPVSYSGFFTMNWLGVFLLLVIMLVHCRIAKPPPCMKFAQPIFTPGWERNVFLFQKVQMICWRNTSLSIRKLYGQSTQALINWSWKTAFNNQWNKTLVQFQMNKKNMQKAKHCLPSITRDVEYNTLIFRHMFVMHCKKYTLCNKK